EQALQYVVEGAEALGVVPTQTCVVAERFFDDAGGMQLVIHAPFGARINRAWGLALRKKFCRAFDFELQAAASDDAILLSIGPQHSFPLDAIFGFVTPGIVEETLVQAALQSPMWEPRWRWNATRSLAVLRAMPYTFLDDAPLEERRSRAVKTGRTQGDLGIVDGDAIRAVVAEAEPDPRDADELHDLMCTAIALQPRGAWSRWYEELV